MMAWKVTHRFLWGFVAGIVLLAVGPVGYAMDPAIPEIVKEQNFDFSDIVFAVRQPGYDWGGKPGHYYANFGRFAYDDDPLQQPGYENRWAYGEGGRLCRLNLKTGGITVLLEDERGAIRDPQMHYDGKKVLFSYRPAGDHFYHLYEIGIDGIGLRQLTDGDYNDIEASYLPDGGIVFVSSRGNRWVNCWLTEVAILYRCDGDGKNIRALSSNNEHDNTPSVLPDGRILYTRWEYVDRSQVHYHHLWTINPDGTAQSVYYGNLNPGVVMIDSKPIPGTRVIASIFSPGHGRSEHQGAVTIVDPRMGPDEKTNVEKITKKENFRDVYPISDRWFLAAQERRIVLMNREGKTWTVYELDREDRAHDLLCHEPAALRGRPRETLLQSRVDLAQETGEVVLANAYLGRNMQGVKPGDIKKILVLESLPKPINFTGGMEPLSYGGTFTMERILGTFPVEADGSAYAELPALRSLIFVALDENDLSVKRMQSFVTLQPGERQGCVGCHEQRVTAPLKTFSSTLTALKREASRLAPIEGVPEVIDFPHDIQPIFNQRCLDCHDYDKRKGGVILTGDRGPYYTHSYYQLFADNQVVDGRNLPVSNLDPRTIGSSASPLMKKIDGSHHDVKVTDRETKLIRLWIETGAPHAGTYAALGSGQFGAYYANRLDRRDLEWPSMQASVTAMGKRCGSCHVDEMKLPTSPSDDLGKQPWIPLEPNDPRRTYSRHLLYNLTRPEKSLILLAALSSEAGGYADGEKHEIVFKRVGDPDYQAMLAAIRDAKSWLDENKRFDMPGFRPRDEYVREMKRYGVIAESIGEDDPIDYYAAEEKYWRSLWYRSNQPPDSSQESE